MQVYDESILTNSALLGPLASALGVRASVDLGFNVSANDINSLMIPGSYLYKSSNLSTLGFSGVDNWGTIEVYGNDYMVQEIYDATACVSGSGQKYLKRICINNTWYILDTI